MTILRVGSHKRRKKAMMYEKELDAIHTEISQMYAAVIDNMEKAFHYYLSTDPVDKKLIIDDDKINAYERAIESLCMQILLKETVYSQDFREVIAALKMVECLERIGDNAYDIKWMADDIKEGNYPEAVVGTDKLVSIVEGMVKDSFTSLIKKDLALAQDVIDRDKEADSAYWGLVLAVAKLADEKKIDGQKTVFESHVDKFLERIGDQATNIAEWVIYIHSGYHKDRVII
ncbi:MAG: hypothetical protein LKM30_02980 [Bacilli bacterium]|jgi:phosphate transport system protein|nr:hypothetical protein [Bacilli bacterium]